MVATCPGPKRVPLLRPVYGDLHRRTNHSSSRDMQHHAVTRGLLTLAIPSALSYLTSTNSSLATIGDRLQLAGSRETSP